MALAEPLRALCLATADDERGTNLLLGAIMLLSDAVVLTLFAAACTAVRPQVMLVPEAPFALQLAVALVLGDLASYWHHRLMHRLDFLWASHVVHHQSRQIRLSTGLRSHPFVTLGTCLAWSPLLVLGISPEAMLAAAGAIGAWVVLIHHGGPWPAAAPSWLGGILNLPAHHLMHHRIDGGGNYGLLLILWDRLFGTYSPPRGGDARCGVAGTASIGTVGTLLWQEWRRILALPPAPAAPAARPPSAAFGLAAWLGAAAAVSLAGALLAEG